MEWEMVKYVYIFFMLMCSWAQAQIQLGWTLHGAAGSSKGETRAGFQESIMRAYPLALSNTVSGGVWARKGNHSITLHADFSRIQNRIDYGRDGRFSSRPMYFEMSNRLISLGWAYCKPDSGKKAVFYAAGQFMMPWKVFIDPGGYSIYSDVDSFEIVRKVTPKVPGIQGKIGISTDLYTGGSIQAGLLFRFFPTPVAEGQASFRFLKPPSVPITNEFFLKQGMVGLFLEASFTAIEIKKKSKNKDSLQRRGSMLLNDERIPLILNGRPVVPQGQIKVDKPEIEFYIYDAGFEDGDSISLNINGNWVLENYLLTKEKRIIRVKLEPGENNYLVLYAINQGKNPPNTVAVSYMDQGREVRIQLKSNLKECGALNFKYIDP